MRSDPTLEASAQPPLGEGGLSDRASSTEPMVPLADYRALLAEIEQLRSQERSRTARIQHLELALDQALTSLDEMRLKLEGQRLLEAQLAATEKFACVQQQAIARLRLRIQQQQSMIDSHLSEVREGTRFRLGAAAPFSAADGAEPGDAFPVEEDPRLTTVLLEESQQQIAELEAEVIRERDLNQRLQAKLLEAQQRVQDLALQVDQHMASLSADSDMDSEEGSPGKRSARSRNRPLARPHRAIATLGQDLARAQIKVEELEIELNRQLRQQALWQHRFQENQSQGEHYRTRLHQLEQQATELQEQIVFQARQVSEYEATIQHWKDQYTTSQSQIARLQELLEEVQLQFLTGERDDPTLSALFSELLAVVEFATLPGDGEQPSSSHRSVSRLNALDLPDFLLRRRNYRTP